MDPARSADIAAWVTGAGLAGLPEPDLLRGYCRRLLAAGLPVAQANVLIDTLHPVYEGRAFRWRRDDTQVQPVLEYGRTSGDSDSGRNWQTSPFRHLFDSGESSMRRRIADEAQCEFPILRDMRTSGHSDYLAMINRFSAEGVIGEMDCIYSSWVTDSPSGFTNDDLAALKELMPPLALAMKCASFGRIAGTLVETYLGRDAGHRVLSGRIERGVADRIEAALWFSDLRGFTRITDAASPAEIIPLLNDYADAVVSSIHDAGGDVLKLIGDGILAIFSGPDRETTCRNALAAEATMRARVDGLNRDRADRGLPVTSVYLGLHTGEVFYGNVGSRERLDFTVVGPAVNETNRIATLCRSAERDTLVSSAFREAAGETARDRLVSVGRYAMRGVARPQELFTLDPGAEPFAAIKSA